MRIDLNFTPQAHDQHIDRAVEYLHALIMGQRQQLFTVQNPAGVFAPAPATIHTPHGLTPRSAVGD